MMLPLLEISFLCALDNVSAQSSWGGHTLQLAKSFSYGFVLLSRVMPLGTSPLRVPAGTPDHYFSLSSPAAPEPQFTAHNACTLVIE